MNGSQVQLIIYDGVLVLTPWNIELALLIHSVEAVVTRFVEIDEQGGLLNTTFHSGVRFDSVELAACCLVVVFLIAGMFLKLSEQLKQLFKVVANNNITVDQIPIEVGKRGFADFSLGSQVKENCPTSEKRFVVCSKGGWDVLIEGLQ